MSHTGGSTPAAGPDGTGGTAATEAGSPAAWQIVAGIEVVALLIALVMPVTPSKTGSDWSPAELFVSRPGYLLDVLAYFIFGNIVLVLLALSFVVYQRWTRDERTPDA